MTGNICSDQKGYKYLKYIAGGFFLSALSVSLIAFVLAMYQTGPDSQQGNWFKLIYIHVPCAWFSLLMLLLAAGSQPALVGGKSSSLVTALHISSIQVGMVCTLLALATGYYWGKVIWGGVIWNDPRFLFQLATLVMFVVVLLGARIELAHSESRLMGAVVLLLCVVVVLANHFSVYLMDTIHQLPSVIRSDRQITIDASMRSPLWLATLALLLMFIALVLKQVYRHLNISTQQHLLSG